VAVLRHGYAPHGRDYVIEVHDEIGPEAGLYELIFTHVPECHCETRVKDEAWPRSWDDVFTDHDRWRAEGEPDGHVWLTWSHAAPGFRAPAWSQEAHAWTHRLKRPIFSMSVETDSFRIALMFHDVRVRRL
jgi:hypothetical protein